MIGAIAPVLGRIAAIESRFSPLHVQPTVRTGAPVTRFADVMAGYAGVPAAGAPGGDVTEIPTSAPPADVESFDALPEARAVPLPVVAHESGCSCESDWAPAAIGSSMAIPTDPVTGVPFADQFTEAGMRHGVPPRLLAAVGWVESRYQPNVVSPAGAEGLMQLMPFVSQALGVDPYDPASAIDGAARLLADHHDRFRSWELAVAAYHAGAGAVARVGGVPSGRTTTYVARVMERMGVR